MDDKFYMNLALCQAEKAYNLGEVPVGAVIVCGDEVISQGYNTREREKSPLGHAEINALLKASKRLGRWRLEDCVMYVTLEPCPMCAGALLQAKMKKVVFGAYDEKFGAVGSKYNLFYDFKFNHNVLFTGGVLETECSKLLQKFFEQRR